MPAARDPMKALSLPQPWAELMINGRKTWEARRWNTAPVHLVGERLAIHAAAQHGPSTREKAIEFGLDPDALAYGAVLGHVLVVEAGTLAAEDEAAALAPCAGLVGIRCIDPVRLPAPMPCRGEQGLFDVEL